MSIAQSDKQNECVRASNRDRASELSLFLWSGVTKQEKLASEGLKREGARETKEPGKKARERIGRGEQGI
jgi:hypothetical protein